jgi:exopolyphosphatase / guanosine-5'-triphosphate,3'-diphosphate pyrophosphatase
MRFSGPVASDHPEVREAAVLDVGSNSVRLVVYRLDGRAMTPIINEKVMAGLGRNLRKEGALSAEGVETAIAALKRFRALLTALGVTEIDAVATAAVREAKDGPDFARRIERETGIKLKTISGQDEALLSANGVLANDPEALGVVGDLGGSSLELIEVSPMGPGLGDTYPLGPLALTDGPFDAARVTAIADAVLSKSKPILDKGGAFYAVGGAWRALGRIDMRLRQHPLGVLNCHEIPRSDVLRLVDVVRKQSRKSLEMLEGAAAKRADALPYAAVVLERVMKWGNFDRVVLSAYGLREGVLAAKLPDSAKFIHPLVASAEAFGAPTIRSRLFGAALDAWIAPVREAAPSAFGKVRDRVVWAAACRLADLGGAFHPDQRAEIMFDLVLRAPFAALTHPERAFLAASVHHRYTRAPPVGEAAYEKLLTDNQRIAASALGAAMRLGADISARAPSVLDGFKLKRADGVLILKVRSDLSHLMTPQAFKRLEPVAEAVGLLARTEI